MRKEKKRKAVMNNEEINSVSPENRDLNGPETVNDGAESGEYKYALKTGDIISHCKEGTGYYYVLESVSANDRYRKVRTYLLHRGGPTVFSGDEILMTVSGLLSYCSGFGGHMGRSGRTEPRGGRRFAGRFLFLGLGGAEFRLNSPDNAILRVKFRLFMDTGGRFRYNKKAVCSRRRGRTAAARRPECRAFCETDADRRTCFSRIKRRRTTEQFEKTGSGF